MGRPWNIHHLMDARSARGWGRSQFRRSSRTPPPTGLLQTRDTWEYSTGSELDRTVPMSDECFHLPCSSVSMY